MMADSPLHQILPLLSEPDSSQIAQAIELLRALDDAGLRAALWDAISLDTPAILVDGPRLLWMPEEGAFPSSVLAALIEMTPAAELAALRQPQRLRRLNLSTTGGRRTPQPARPWPHLQKLAWFPQLRTLHLSHMVLSGPLPSVRRIRLSHCRIDGSLQIPDGVESLQLIEVTAPRLRLETAGTLELLLLQRMSLRGWTGAGTAAHTLQIQRCTDTGDLRALEGLTLLDTQDARVPLLPDTVEEVIISATQKRERLDISALARLPALRAVRIPYAQVVTLAPLARARELRLLVCSQGADLRPVGALPWLLRVECNAPEHIPESLEGRIHPCDDIPF